MKKSGQFSVQLPLWMDKIITEMSLRADQSKNYVINELLRSKLQDMGYKEAEPLIERLTKTEGGDEQELHG